MKKLIHAEEGSEPSLSFTPPEILEGDHSTFKSVVWSLGIMLYYLATLKVPFEDSNKFAMLEKIEKGEREELPEGFSEPVRELLSQLLQKDQSKRPSIDDIIHKPIIQDQIRRIIEEFREDEQMMESLYESIQKYHPLYFEMQLKEDSSDQEKKTKLLFDSLKRLLHGSTSN
jgi:serine/threonine protein kinase